MTLFALFAVALVLILFGSVFALLWGMTHPPRYTYTNALASGTPTTPEEAGLTGQDVSFALSDGRATPGFLITGKNPDGPVVITLHGFGSSRYRCFIWMQPYLAYASQLVFFDQRGHGESQAPTCHGGTTEVDDALGLLDQLPPGTIDRGVVFYGRSMGASTAIGAAARLSQNADRAGLLRGVVAEGPYERWTQPVWRLFARKRWPGFAIIPLTQLAVRLIMPRLARMDRLVDARQLTCPLLVLHGTADDTCPLDIGRRIANAARDATLVTFEGGEHYGLAQDFPERYEAAVCAFFEKCNPKP